MQITRRDPTESHVGIQGISLPSGLFLPAMVQHLRVLLPWKIAANQVMEKKKKERLRVL